MRVLVIEDDASLNEIVCAFLASEGYRCTPAFSGSEARMLIEGAPGDGAGSGAPAFDLVVTDLMLPGCPGEDLVALARERLGNVPVIVTSAKGAVSDRVALLRTGADDYLVKPFLPQELTLRIGAILRRCYPQDAGSNSLALASCTVDLDNAEVHRADGSTAQLTAKELSLLEALARNAGRIVTIDALCEELWGPACFGYENSLMTHVRRLREKIEADPSHPESLVTVKGLGYRLNARKRP